MRTLLQLPAANFERANDAADAAVAALHAAVRDARPNVLVISGDLPPDARGLLEAFPSSHVVLSDGLADDGEPFHEDEELAIASLATHHGPVGDQQLTSLRAHLCSRTVGVTKFVVTHGAFELPEEEEPEPSSRTPATVEVLARCGADVLLAAGPTHAETGRAARRYQMDGRAVLVVRAGRADSFNLIRVQHPHLQVERHAWRPEAAAFKPAASETFRRTHDGWERLSDEVAAGITFAEDTTGLQPTIPQDS